MICPLVWMGIKVSCCYCVTDDFPLNNSWQLPYVIRCSYVGCIYVYSCCIFFLDWSLDHVVSVFVSYKGLYLSYKGLIRVNSYLLLVSICMKYLFPAPHFQSVCVPRLELGLLADRIYRVLVFVTIRQSLSFVWRI